MAVQDWKTAGWGERCGSRGQGQADFVPKALASPIKEETGPSAERAAEVEGLEFGAS
jgi:hypothetical protein